MLTKQLKKTPLTQIHIDSGARMVDFAGWNMPVQYCSIIQEHMAVRKTVGLFDISHMGEFIVKGKGAKAFIQRVIANDLERLAMPNTALYTQFVNQGGGTVDDLIVYRRQNDYLLVVNAANIDKDWQWLQGHLPSDVELVNESDKTALLAVQGPKASALIKDLVGEQAANLKTFHYEQGTIGGIAVGLSRTGYTGEDGFEIFLDALKAVELWQKISKAGEAYGIKPCGLGARDTLRLEASLPLYGHELDDRTSPLEAGLDFSVSLTKNDFIGKDKLLNQKNTGLKKKLVCLTTDSKALPRQGYVIKAKANGEPIGVITSGSQGIAVGHPIAMGYVSPQYAQVGQQLYIDIRGMAVPSQVVARPFYKAKK